MEPISLYEKRDELRRVLSSRHFAKAKKKSRFLKFVCEQTFLGNANKLNEYLIGVEVYERGQEFDPHQDPIVRVQAHDIRRSLRDYYEDEGRTSPWRIELPPGHYVPVFTRVSPAGAPESEREAVTPAPPTQFLGRNALLLSLALACVVLGLLLVRERSRAKAPAPVQAGSQTLPEGMLWFWKPFLPPAEPPLVVIPNHPLLRAAHDGDSAETLSRSHLIPKQRLPEFRDTIHFRELKGFYFVPSTTDFTAVGEALGLFNLFDFFADAGQRIHLKQSRLVDFNEIKGRNSVLLGGINRGVAGSFCIRRGSGSTTE